MDPDHKRYIPSTYWKQILCSTDYNYNEELLIVVCTKQADLIEFQIDNENNDVKNTNCIEIDYSNVATLRVFFALNELVGIFYLLHTNTGELIVVEKLKKTLKIKEKIYRVQKFEISDVHNRGRPEVSIWYMNSKEPNLVTDFSDELIEQSHSDGPCDKLANSLKIQLKMLTDKISGKQNLLEDKIKFRNETAQSLFTSSQQDIKINSSRQRIFRDKLFILMELEHIGNIQIVDMNFILNLKSNLTVYQSYFIETDTPQISEVRSLKHKCLGVVMLDIPVSLSENLTLAGTLYYQVNINKNQIQSVNVDETITNNVTSDEKSVTKVAQDTRELPKENQKRLTIPSVELDANTLLGISCQCQIGVSTTVQDLYCIMLASFEREFIILKIEPLLEMLTTRLKCSKLSVQTDQSCSYYYCNQGIFNENLFCITNSKLLSVYYKNESQITLISVLLKDIVKEKEETSTSVFDVSKFQTDISHCLALLRNEILLDTIQGEENPRKFFNVEKKHLFEIQKIISKYQTDEK